MQNPGVEFYRKQIEYGELIAKYASSVAEINYGLSYAEISRDALNDYIVAMKKETPPTKVKKSLIEKTISLSIIRHVSGFFNRVILWIRN